MAIIIDNHVANNFGSNTCLGRNEQIKRIICADSCFANCACRSSEQSSALAATLAEGQATKRRARVSSHAFARPNRIQCPQLVFGCALSTLSFFRSIGRTRFFSRSLSSPPCGRRTTGALCTEAAPPFLLVNRSCEKFCFPSK